MAERIVPRNCTLEQAMTIIIRNRSAGTLPAWVLAADRARLHLRRFIQHNAPQAARRTIAHHYDLSDELSRAFLDDDMQSSCAYFRDPEMPLEAAQAAKKEHIATKLLLEPDMHVLDIGCGWGGGAWR